MNKKLLSMILAISIILTMIPVGVMAEEENTSIDIIDEIIEFEELEEGEKLVDLGTSLDDLELPETLTATVRTTSTTTISAIELEDSESDELEQVNDPQFEDTIQPIPVTWTSQPEYDMDTEGDYVFTPIIEGYEVSAELPEIIVTVEAKAELALMMERLVSPMVADPVATIGSIDYETLQAAVSAVKNDDTITLLKDINLTDYITIPDSNSNDFTLDLNGKNLKGGIVLGHNGSGKLTITDTASGGGGTVEGTSGAHTAIYNNEAGSVNIYGGSVIGANVAISNEGSGSVSISGGSVTGENIAIDNNEAGSVNIYGGSVTGENIAIFNRSGSVNISGGSVISSKVAINSWTKPKISIPSGSAIIKGGNKAMDKAPELGEGMQITASESFNGEPLVSYNVVDIAKYKYLKFEPYKNGAAITTAATVASKSYDQITINAAEASSNSGNQTIEYAISASNSVEPTNDWQPSLSFTGLSPSTTYYVWARTAEKEGYNAGSAVASVGITTTDAPVNASISPASATFDLNPNGANHEGIAVTLTRDSYGLTAVKNGETTLKQVTDYTVNGDIYTITQAYLKTLPVGKTTITFDMDGGTNPTLDLIIEDTRTELTSVTIGNTAPKFGDTLSATIDPSEATVSYNWKAGGSQVGTDKTYEVKVADIGKAITLTVIGTGTYKGTATSTATSAVAAKDYNVSVASTKSVAQGSGLSTLPTADAGGVSGTLNWYSDISLTTEAVDSDISTLNIGGSVTLYWSFTTNMPGYVTDPKTGSCVVIIVSGSAQTLTFAESTVTKTVGDLPFTNTLAHSVGTGAVSYSSSNVSVANVNPTSGAVMIVGAGITTITANAAMVPGIYAPGSATFTLTVNPASATFDLNPNGANHEGIAVTLTRDSYGLTAVKNGETTLKQVTDYTVNGDIYTITQAYLKTLPVGKTTITFDMDGGTNPTLDLIIEDTRTELTSVTIGNTAPKFGDTLSATIEPSEATVSYSWKADGSQVGTDTTYEVKADDIGKTITLTATGIGTYKGTATSTATSAVAAKDYNVSVASTKSVAQGSGLSTLPTADAGGVSGTLNWYSDISLTTEAVDSDISTLNIGGSVTLYWSFTTNMPGYVTDPKTGSCVVIIVSGSAQTLTFAESTVTKTVGDLPFTNTLAHSVGTGAVSYSSSNVSVANVNPTSGTVAIVGAGITTITANAAIVPGIYAPGSATFTLTVNPAPTYTITANPTSKNFGSLTEGYSSPVAEIVTILNTGNTSVTLTQPTSTNYTIVALSDTTLAANNVAFFTVTPKTGLAVGNYDEILTVGTDHSTNATIELSFSVTAAPTTTFSVTYNVNGGSGSMTTSTATQGEAYTLPSNGFTAPSGKQFKAWAIGSTAGKQVNAGETYTFTGDTTVYAIWEDIPVTNHTVAVNGSYATTTGAGSYTAGTSVTIHAGSRSNYTFTGWTASGVTLANANSVSISFTMPANTVAITANWTYNGGSGSGSGSGGGGGSSSNDNSSPVIVTPPAADKPNDPTQGEIKVPGTVDGKGNVTVSITGKTVTDAFDKALADAKKNGTAQNGITVVLRVDTGNKTGSNVTVNLPKAVQDTIIAKKIVNTIVVVDNPYISVGMDLATVQEINKQAKSDVNITATRTDSGKLTGEAKKAIGSRPVFDLKVNYGNGKAVSSFGAGSVSVTIPYTLSANEKPENVQAVYVDSKGKVHWLVNSVYDSVEKVVRFSTDHFSTYGIGYKQANTVFADITGHWAKEDIEFVVSRGLFSGTSNTIFSPNTAMTRGMFVTALGRLANADVSGYVKSSFNDVKNDAYYMGYIEWASKNGIVNGVGNNKFAPDQSITREQMAVIMSNYAKTIGYTLPKVHMENTFADNEKISTYAKEAVKQMQMAGVISGKKGNLFDPQGTATRAEVSAVLRRTMNELE